MAVDVLNALSLIGKSERSEVLVAAILALIFVLRDWSDCDPTRTSKIRDSGDQRISRRVDDRNRTVYISGIDACAVGCHGRKNRTETKRDIIDDRVCACVQDNDLSE